MEDYKFRLEQISFSSLQKSITLPTFQRNLVWTQNKKISFIRTIMNGYPFGSFLFYKDNLERYVLVDGLQRYSTLIEFSKNPLSFVKIYDICKESIDELVAMLKDKGLLIHNSSISKEKVISVINSNITSIDFKKKVDRKSIANEISWELSNDNSDKLIDIRCLIVDLIDEIKNAVDITYLSIPYIVFEGEYEALPNIYEELNSNGTSLTKYEVYAAKWNHIFFENIDDVTILEKVENKYISMQENSSIEIKDYSEGIILKQKRINLFEYCYALGKILQEECRYIFKSSSNNNQSDVDSIGFILLSVILSNSRRKIDKLNEYFSINSSKELIQLKDKIVNCSKQVEKILQNFIVMPNNKTFFYRYRETLIICIIATMFKITYTNKGSSISFIQRTDSKKELELFKKICHYVFFLILLQGIGIVAVIRI